MDWNAIGAIGEVIGAAGVVFSLIYLATQIRSSSKQANADTIYNLQKGQSDVMEMFSSNPDIAKLLVKVQRGDSLEAHEDVQIDFIVARAVGIHAAIQAAADSGIIGEDYLEDIDTSLTLFASNFKLAEKMWRFAKVAHPSVSDGRIFKKLRLAVGNTQT
ncbi:MAG: hypothetical protein KUG75_15275 [Pseudomonadales bacterium]|nr:hypothetical protein [Pseudomonadales bacterium]